MRIFILLFIERGLILLALQTDAHTDGPTLFWNLFVMLIPIVYNSRGYLIKHRPSANTTRCHSKRRDKMNYIFGSIFK